MSSKSSSLNSWRYSSALKLEILAIDLPISPNFEASKELWQNMDLAHWEFSASKVFRNPLNIEWAAKVAFLFNSWAISRFFLPAAWT